jgi:hypothetical protein
MEQRISLGDITLDAEYFVQEVLPGMIQIAVKDAYMGGLVKHLQECGYQAEDIAPIMQIAMGNISFEKKLKPGGLDIQDNPLGPGTMYKESGGHSNFSGGNQIKPGRSELNSNTKLEEEGTFSEDYAASTETPNHQTRVQDSSKPFINLEKENFCSHGVSYNKDCIKCQENAMPG